MDMIIISIFMQCLGLWCILFAVENFKAPINEKTGNKFGSISFGILLLFGGFFLVGMFGWFNGTVGNILTITISLLIVSFFYFYLPKTKLYKNRDKAKQPIEDGTNLMFRLIGQGIMLVGAGHILFAIYVWLKNGVWTTISLGDWGLTILKLNELGRFDTGWWAINKVLNYIIIDSSAALPLIVIGYIIYINASDD